VKNIIVAAAVAGLVAVALIACDHGAGPGGGASSAAAAVPDQTARVDCAISAGPCAKGSGDAALTLEITPRPVRSMTDLVFVVGGPAAATAGAAGVIDLTMPGMFMGKNEVQLRPDGAGHLTGKGVMVRCPSGHLTWSAATTVKPAGGAPVTGTFTFDLSP